MKRSSKYILGAGLVILMHICPAVGQSVIQAVLKRVNAHSSALESLRADTNLTQTTIRNRGKFKVISKSSKGTLLYARLKDKTLLMRLDQTSPTESLVIKDGKFDHYQPTNKKALSGKAGDLPFMFFLADISKADFSMAEINKTYSPIVFLGKDKTGDGRPAFKLEFAVKKGVVAKPFTVWIDGDGMPIQFEYSKTKNTTTMILLTNIVKNLPLKKSQFNIEIPKRTRYKRTKKGARLR